MTLRIEFNAGDNTYLNGLDIRLHLGTKPSTGTVKSRYTINIHNKSAVDKDFMIFTGEPQVNGSIGGKALTYVFMDGLIGSGNTGSFEFSPDIYAVCMQKTGRGVPQISTKGPIRLGSKDYKGETLRIALQNGIPRFIDNDPPNAGDGSFQICTGPDFDQGSKIYIGIGLKPEGGQVAMAAGVEASPNATVSFVPSTTCYAAPGNSKSGTIIDASQVGNKATFDFAYRSNSATAQYNPNGTWTQM